MRRWEGGREALGAVLVTVAVGSLGAQPLVTDARCVAQAGLSVVELLESSPGAPRPAGSRLRLDLQRLYAGTGLVVGCVGVECVGAQAGGAIALAELWSPVGEAQALRLSAQLLSGGARVGVGMELRGVALGGVARAWEVLPRLGCSWSSGRGVAFACRAERTPGPKPVPRLALALRWGIAPGITCGLQTDREPGIPASLRLGIDFESGAFRLFSGFEAATQTCSLGFSWDWKAGEIAWGAWTHPALGWSHAWTYAVSR